MTKKDIEITEYPCQDCGQWVSAENAKRFYHYETDNPYAPYRTVILHKYRCSTCHERRLLNGPHINTAGSFWAKS